jgi:hypothetical protein
MSELPEPVKAKLIPMSDPSGGGQLEQIQRDNTLTVHFNPESLRLVQTNALEGGQGEQPVQHVTAATAKLEMTLLFDTTRAGYDVRDETRKLAWFMDPVGNTQGGTDAERRLLVPAQVKFQWGTFVFTGYVSTYEETIDFFSTEGIPLRSSVKVELSQGNRRFESVEAGDPALKALEALQVGVASTDLQLAGEAPLATAGGSPAQDRTTAAENDVEDLRRPAAPRVSVSTKRSIQRAVSFSAVAGGSGRAGAGAVAGAGASAGFGAGASAGFGAGASAGANFGVSAGAGASAGFGASASAASGFTASAGASASFGASAGASASASASFGASLSVKPLGSANEAFFAAAAAGNGTMAAFAGLHARVDLPPPRVVAPPLPRPGPTSLSFRAGAQASVPFQFD